MSEEDRDFERFSGRLDDEWRRERLRAQAPQLIDASAAAELVKEIERADPLGAAAQGWLVTVREAFRTWPGRLAFAGAACALLVIGFALGRATIGPGGPRIGVGGMPPMRVEAPDYKPEARTALGIGAPVKPEADEKFREAMAFYGTPEFASKAQPLLRQAVTADPDDDRAQFWLGVTLLLNEKFTEAVGPLEAATRLAPGNVLYKQYLLFAYLRTGDVERALRAQTDLMKRP